MTAGHRTCAFCGTGPVTAEHVWADWITERLDAAGLGGPYTWTRERPEGPPIRSGSTRIDLTVKRFCKSCNNGWMSDIERQTIPVLERMMFFKRGRHVGLSSKDQTLLAPWAYKTALVADFALEPGPFVPDDWFSDFYRRRWPRHDGVVIWTCAYWAPEKPTFSYRQGRTMGEDVRDFRGTLLERTTTESNVITISVWRAIFQVLLFHGGPWRPSVSRSFDPILTQLWPATGQPANWPESMRGLDHAGLMRFVKRADFV